MKAPQSVISNYTTSNRQQLIIRWMCIATLAAIGLGIGYNSLFLEKSFATELSGFGLLILGALVLNLKQHIRIASYLFYSTASCLVGYMCLMEGYYSMEYLFYFPLILTVAITFDGKKQQKDLYITLSIVVLALITVTILYALGIPSAPKLVGGDQFTSGLFNIGLSIILFVFALIVILYANNLRLGALHSAAKERELLLAEMNHRIKNNMAVVAGMLSLHANSAEDPQVQETFMDAKSRIQSMAVVHTLLYKNKSFSTVALDDLARSLEQELRHMYNDSGMVEVELDLDPVTTELSIAVPIGLIANEVISNCYKHGLKDGQDGHLTIRVKEKTDHILVAIKDNGPGAPDTDALENEGSLGMTIIQSLIDQIDAQHIFKNDSGLTFEMMIKKG